jgi:hypothetical protein
MITNSIVLLDPTGAVAYTGHIVSLAPLMLDPASMTELTADFTCGLVAGASLSVVLLGFRYTKKALGWVDSGGE